MKATEQTLAHTDTDTGRRSRCMDGTWVYVGSDVICFSLPKAQPCLSRVLCIQTDGRITIDNGRTVRNVDPMSCILQAAN